MGSRGGGSSHQQSRATDSDDGISTSVHRHIKILVAGLQEEEEEERDSHKLFLEDKDLRDHSKT